MSSTSMPLDLPSYQALQEFAADKAANNLQERKLWVEGDGNNRRIVYKKIGSVDQQKNLFSSVTDDLKVIVDTCRAKNISTKELVETAKTYSKEHEYNVNKLARKLLKGVDFEQQTSLLSAKSQVKVSTIRNNLTNFEKLRKEVPSPKELIEAGIKELTLEQKADLLTQALKNGEDRALAKAIIVACDPQDFVSPIQSRSNNSLLHLICAHATDAEIVQSAIAMLNTTWHVTFTSEERKAFWPPLPQAFFVLKNKNGKTPIELTQDTSFQRNRLLDQRDTQIRVMLNNFEPFQKSERAGLTPHIDKVSKRVEKMFTHGENYPEKVSPSDSKEDHETVTRLLEYMVEEQNLLGINLLMAHYDVSKISGHVRRSPDERPPVGISWASFAPAHFKTYNKDFIHALMDAFAAYPELQKIVSNLPNTTT